MEGLRLNIPERLYLAKLIFSAGLILSFFATWNLWGGQRYFPANPVFEPSFLAPPFDLVLPALSVLALGLSMVFNSRSFLLLALLINCFLVLFDLNRLQCWFYFYNAALFVLLFNNGRLDSPQRCTSLLIILQLIIAAVYVSNGVHLLADPDGAGREMQAALSPLQSMVSERQFGFLLRISGIIPWLLILTGPLLLIPAAKYLAVSFALILHFALFVLLIPSFSSGYGLWIMNAVFGSGMFVLFSGNTRQRYYSITVLFRHPLLYAALYFFLFLPFSAQRVPDSVRLNYSVAGSAKDERFISPEDYRNLPMYARAFCTRTAEGYLLDASKWCRVELKSDPALCFSGSPQLQFSWWKGKDADDLSIKGE